MSTETAAADKKDRHAPTFNIFINDARLEAHERTLTGAQIAALGGVPEGKQIFLEIPGPGDDDPVGRDEVVELESGMRFYDVPAGNLG